MYCAGIQQLSTQLLKTCLPLYLTAMMAVVVKKEKKANTGPREGEPEPKAHCSLTGSIALSLWPYQLLGGGCGQNGGTLVLSVHHHNPSMRAAAVRQLGKSLQEENVVCIVYNTCTVQCTCACRCLLIWYIGRETLLCPFAWEVV